MLVRAGYEITVECDRETPLLALLNIRPSRVPDLRSDASIVASHCAPLHCSRDEFGNVRTRTTAPVGNVTLAADFLIHESGLPDRVDSSAPVREVSELPDHVVTFLLGRR